MSSLTISEKILSGASGRPTRAGDIAICTPDLAMGTDASIPMALVYVTALADFFGRAYGIGERDGRIVEMLLFAGLVYFVICFSASLAVKLLSRKTAS